jgi:DNA-binding SARP family transcriptional activator/WD40 repeat protein/energy-coupling factor transporter ATP-binding protein EcfA2
MQIRVLGPVEASAEGRSLPLGGSKQRALLAMLGLEANRTVSADHLIEGLWGEHPPASAAKMLQNYVWRLRTVLGEDADAEILTRGRGYELRIDPDSLDVRRFERLLGEASRAAEGGQPGDAAREALALWRGPALSDVADEPFAAPETRRLEELRLEAAELAIDADLAAGRHQEVAAEIDALVAEHPLRERIHGQRMLALYRCGRQAEALEAYRDARRTLVEEIGVEPGPELRRLHDAILRQDPSLEIEPAPPELPRELDTVSAPPLAGRDEELARLRGLWQGARRREGALVTLVGGHGMGKTRLAAELAGEAHREGAMVLYVAGSGSPDAAFAAVAKVREARRPTLLVIDDADRAGAEVRAMLSALEGELRARPALVLATGQEAAALARLRPSASIALEALDAGAVRQIAVLYAPAGAAGEVPVDTLLETSRGVARRVHAVASEWARREAARRVDAVAARAGTRRTQAEVLEAELAGSVVALQSTRERVERLATAEPEGPVICPFKGLATFDVDDAEYFFGREQLVAELVARLVGARLLAIVGASGSGKSSALRAGVLPALAGGVLPGSDAWAQALMRPGEHPMRELHAAVSGLGDERRIVLAVDQFEETFTACRDERERDAFVAALIQAARHPDGRNVVVLAVRADFYARCAAYPELSRLVGANNVLVGPMSRDELRRAITRPAERVGLRVEAQLEDALVADVEGQPGALPLLSTALLELWQQRRGRRLQLAAYSRTGGVHGAVARLAEDAFGRLEPSQQAAARKILLRLAGEGEGGAIVRRRVPLAELEAHSADVARVVDVLTDRRLLTVSAGTIEVAHEALLREWPRLRGWLEEDAQGRRLHRHVIDSAHDWDAEGRDPGELYRGARLTSALEWRPAHEDELNATERAFLDASRAASERAHRRLQIVLASVAALLVVAVIAALVALDQRARARDEATVAEAQRLGAQALTVDALDQSLLLARQAVALDDSLATRGNLLAALLRSPAAIGVMRAEGRLLGVALDPSGRKLAVTSNNGDLFIFDAVTRRLLARRHVAEYPSQAVRYSPDGTRLVVASGDESGTVVDLLDARTYRRLARHRVAAVEPLNTVSFSPDSRVLLASHVANAPPGPEPPGQLSRWDARTGRALARPAQLTHAGAFGIWYTEGGSRLVTMSEWERETVIRDARTLRPLRRLPAWGVPSASAVTPDARLAALGRDDGSVRLLDLRSGHVRIASGRHDAAVQHALFSPDGRTLVTAGDDAKVIVWDVATASVRETFEGHAGKVTETALTPDGRTAFSVSLDGTVIAWDLAGDRRLGRLFRAGSGNPNEAHFAVTPNGDTLAVPQQDGSVNVVDARTLASTGTIAVTPGVQLTSVTIAGDGRTLAATAADGTVGLWDLRTRRALAAPVHAVKHGPAWGATFSGDGRWMAQSGIDQVVRLWDVRRHKQLRTLRFKTPTFDVALSPDGKTLAVPTWSPREGAVEILAVPSLRRLVRLPIAQGRVATFSPDGHLLHVADQAGTGWLFDTRTWNPRGRPMRGHAGISSITSFSPDGRTLATTSSDGTTRLWDVASTRPIGRPLPGEPNTQVGAHFVRGGTHLAAVYASGRAYLWDVRPSSWRRQACAVAGRPLTRAEWEEALPGREYDPVCSR